MKKLVYPVLSFSIIFFTACGGGDTSTTENNASTPEEATPTEEVAEEVVEEETVAEEEVAAEGGDIDAGKDFFASSGCVACHQVDAKTVGPSLKTIAEAYADNKEGLVAFLKEEGEAIVDPAQAAVMQPQLAITKVLPENELNNVVDYILSNK